MSNTYAINTINIFIEINQIVEIEDMNEVYYHNVLNLNIMIILLSLFIQFIK